MSSVNKVILIGNVGGDPTIKDTPTTKIAKFALATTDSWTDKASGEKKHVTEWHRIVTFNKLAELVETYVRKGMLIYIEGKFRTEKWDDTDGQKHYETTVVAAEMKFLGKKNEPSATEFTQPKQQEIKIGDGITGLANLRTGGVPPPKIDQADPFANFDDDIPF